MEIVIDHGEKIVDLEHTVVTSIEKVTILFLDFVLEFSSLSFWIDSDL